MLKQIVDRVAAAAGLRVIPEWRLQHYDLANHLHALLERLQIDCVFDVGANAGQYGRFLRDQVYFKGWILSFEPQPGVFAELQAATHGDSRWRAFNYALGREEGILPFSVTRASQFGSFLPPDNDATLSSSVISRDNQVSEVIEVPVRTLEKTASELSREIGFDRFYLKLDTQGYDLEVMRGAGSVRPLIAAVQSEMSLVRLYSGAPDCEESLRYFRTNGFDVTGFFSVGRDPNLRIVDFDCVMISRSLLK
jgi:FkbM family methyltransferase